MRTTNVEMRYVPASCNTVHDLDAVLPENMYMLVRRDREKGLHLLIRSSYDTPRDPISSYIITMVEKSSIESFAEICEFLCLRLEYL